MLCFVAWLGQALRFSTAVHTSSPADATLINTSVAVVVLAVTDLRPARMVGCAVVVAVLVVGDVPR